MAAAIKSMLVARLYFKQRLDRRRLASMALGLQTFPLSQQPANECMDHSLSLSLLLLLLPLSSQPPLSCHYSMAGQDWMNNSVRVIPSASFCGFRYAKYRAYAVVCISRRLAACQSVCPSHTSPVSKRRKLGSRNLH